MKEEIENGIDIPGCKSPSGRHEWVVFSTALAQGWLMLECPHCLAHASVDDPTQEEWETAFHAPSEPYIWNDAKRVTVRGEYPNVDCLHVQHASDDSWIPSERWEMLKDQASHHGHKGAPDLNDTGKQLSIILDSWIDDPAFLGKPDADDRDSSGSLLLDQITEFMVREGIDDWDTLGWLIVKVALLRMREIATRRSLSPEVLLVDGLSLGIGIASDGSIISPETGNPVDAGWRARMSFGIQGLSDEEVNLFTWSSLLIANVLRNDWPFRLYPPSLDGDAAGQEGSAAD